LYRYRDIFQKLNRSRDSDHALSGIICRP